MKQYASICPLCVILAGFIAPMTAAAQDGEPNDPAEPESDNGKIEQSSSIPKAVQAELDALRTEIKKIKAHNEERELAELQADAETAITAGTGETEEKLASKTFGGGERSLQALNPELSIVGDFYGQFVYQDGEIYSSKAANGETSIRTRSGFFPRVAGIHFQANLDPFAFAKFVVGVTPSKVIFGEGYLTWHALTSRLSLTFGKFHQQFGIVNRWHAPGLDQFAYPLMIAEHFGGPLNQTGLSALVTIPPLWAHHIELMIQITNGENAKLFAGEFLSIPSGLLHMRNYWDLNRDTYLEIGLTGLFGVNNHYGKAVENEAVPIQIFDAPPDDDNRQEVHLYDSEGNPVYVAPGGTGLVNEDEEWHLTAVGGADLTINWEPLKQAKYKGVTWRTEFLYAYKQLPDDSIKSWGAYSYIQGKPIRNWIFGVRGDITQVFQVDNDDKYTWGVSPYITWWQSPWVRLRLEYDHIRWAEGETDHRAILQFTVSAGPHKHERY